MASKKKGLSVDDKRRKMLEIFFESRDFFHYKDIEKIAAKQKGITLQTVKETLDGLVADRLVTCEKIGTSNYYWALPSTAAVTRNNRITELEEELRVATAKATELENALDAARKARPESADRTTKLAMLDAARKAKAEIDSELQKYADNDPAVYEARKAELLALKQEVNKWTENIWAIKSYVVNNLGMQATEFDERFEIDPEMDTM